MIKLIRNLKIRTKLYISFILISLILLFVGVREYYALKTLEKNQSYMVKSLSAADAIMEAKYYLRLDMQTLMEIQISEEETGCDHWWIEHVGTGENFIEEIDNLIKNTEFEEAAGDYKAAALHIQTLAKNIKYRYDSVVSPNIEEVYTLKLEYFKIEAMANEGQTDSVITINQQDIYNQKYQINEKIKSIDERLDTVYTDLLNQLNTTGKNTKHIVNESQENSKELVKYSLNETAIMVLAGIVLSLLIAFVLARSILNPIEKLQNLMLKLVKGELPDKLEFEAKNEIGEISNTVNALISGLKETARFSVEIGKGNFDSNYKPMSDKDVLGNALLEMRNRLKEAGEEEAKRKEEDEIRNWSSEGLSKFTDILRYNKNIEELSADIIKNLVKYIKANQGGLFILNDEDKENVFLELKASYAFDRQKYLEKTIRIGEGLVGTAAIEKQTIYLKDVPNDYIEIKSGLGEANPRNIAIVPLKMDDNVLGVIEIASFNELKKYEIDFLEKVAESIAASFSTVKINARTAELLEKFQAQAKEMEEQENEMRKNMEQMQAAQEQSERREEMLKNKIEELNSSQKQLERTNKEQMNKIERIEKDSAENIREIEQKEKHLLHSLEKSMDSVIIINNHGVVEFFNNAAQRMWGFSQDEVVGKNVSMLMPKEFADVHNDKIEKYIKTGVKNIIDIGREVPIRKKDTSQKKVFLYVVETKIGEESKFTGFIRDTSLMKGADDELKKYKESVKVKEAQYRAKIKELNATLRKHGIK